MLIDRCIVEVRSGKGGDGAISFLRDRNTQLGGPDGGNGGKGGSVFFLAKANLNTLYNFRHSRVIMAGEGENGHGQNMYGHGAADVIVEVPVGTVVSVEATGDILADLKIEGQTVEVAKGGRGGRGNACFKSSRHRIPKIAENGHPGERKRLILELKMLADAGLIGFPNVGKSTFLNVVTKANVPTADYPFTTVVPNLGVCYLQDGRSFVLADMPGLIKGAHEGKGLGIQFLRHIERCRVLLHLVAMNGEREPFEEYQTINEELKDYGADLDQRPQVVVASFMDSEGAPGRKAAFDKALGFESLPLSSLTHLGIDAILAKTMDLLEKTPVFPLKGMGQEGGMKIYDAHKNAPERAYEIREERKGYWRISGQQVEATYALINVSTDEGIQKLIRFLDKIGVDDRLHDSGAKNGDTVAIGDFEFEYTQ
jgi:GTP-binding protein